MFDFYNSIDNSRIDVNQLPIEKENVRLIKKTKEFIEKANIIHENKYDYSQTKYVSASSKVIIICPNHGSWSVVPPNHITRKSGCPKCSRIKTVE